MAKENQTNVVVTKKESELKMAKEIKKQEVKKVILFGDEIEFKQLTIDDVIELVKKRFNHPDKIETGKVCYYILGMKHYKMINLSNIVIAGIARNFILANGLKCATTGESVNWYNNKINKGIVNIKEDFKKSGRALSISNVDFSKYNFKL